MNELTTQQVQLPDTIEDLSKFVLYNEERIQALRASIRAIKKVQLAKEVYEQKLAEAQEVGQITVEAAQKMGELLLQIQTSQGRRTDLTSSDARTKSEQLDEIGITRQRSSEYEQMALHPEQVQAAIQKAIERGDVVSRSQVMKEIKALKDENSRLKADNITLSNRAKPEVIEKEVIKEVVPPDYEMFKREAAEAKTYRKLHDEAAEKLKASESQLEALKKKMNDPDEQRTRDMHLDAIALCMGVSNFLEKFGGWTYFMSELDRLSVGDRKAAISAVTAIARWADEMLNTTVSEVIE